MFYTNLKTLECGQTDVLCTSVGLTWDYLPKQINPQLIGYVDVCYLYNPHNGGLQIWYLAEIDMLV